MTSDSDADLVVRIRNGETECFAVLVERYQARLFHFALGMVGQPDAAADLVQDALVKAYTALASCHQPERFRAWLYRILSNRCKDYLKSRRRTDLSLDEGGAGLPASEDPHRDLERADLEERLNRVLQRLPDAQREAFLLKHVEGRSYEEMAEILGASVSALKMRVMRAREALQEMLREAAPYD